jgi:hypothetical protein
MEQARKLRQQQPDPNHAFLQGGSMAKRILSKYPIHFTHEEFQHCRRALTTISNQTGNLLQMLAAVEKRSADEFNQAMKIIRKGGAL